MFSQRGMRPGRSRLSELWDGRNINGQFVPDGQYIFTIRDIETLDVCYSHTTQASKVVACFPWTKNK